MYNKKSGRFDQDDNEKNGYFTPRYNQQRSNNSRYNGNNRQRNTAMKSGYESDVSNWRKNDSSGQRQMFNRNQQNGYNRMDTIRSETENLVPVQDVVTDPSSIKLVKAFREEQMADVKDEDRQPSVVNNKIVYSLKCVILLSEVESDLTCPLSYTVYEKKYVPLSPHTDEEVLDTNCWDMPTNESTTLDFSNSLEMERQQFWDQRQKESQEAVEREIAEVEQDMQQLEAQNGSESILDMLGKQLPEDASPHPEEERGSSLDSSLDSQMGLPMGVAEETAETMERTSGMTPISPVDPSIRSMRDNVMLNQPMMPMDLDDGYLMRSMPAYNSNFGCIFFVRCSCRPRLDARLVLHDSSRVVAV